jgi:hypothetical protein
MTKIVVTGQIYLITNKVNGKQYVGQTMTHRYNHGKLKLFGYLERFKEHCQSKKNTLLAKSLRKYGVDKFTVELLCECDIAETDDEERKYISQYNTMYPDGLNMIYGSPHQGSVEFPRISISKNLKKYYDDVNIKVKHSVVHRNKHTKINTKDVSCIEIRPIKENGENKIVYAYIRYEDGTTVRKRYGGIHETYEECLKRCLDMCRSMVGNDQIKFIDDKIDDRLDKREVPDHITCIDIRLHSLKTHDFVAVYVSHKEMKSWADKKKYLFGGITITLEDAYQQAVDFAKKIKPKNIQFTVKDTLIAKLSDCGNPLKP